MKMKKSLMINSIYNVLYKLLNLLFPLITTSYVSHKIYASGIGKVASAQNIAQYFIIIAALGIPEYGIREIAKTTSDSNNLSKVFSELFIINLISSILCSVCYYFMLIPNYSVAADKKLYYVAGVSIIFNIINVDWLYQGVEDYRYIAFRSFWVKIISLAAIFFFVKNYNDYINYAIILVAANAGNYLFNVYNLRRKKVHIVLKDLCFRKHIKPILILLGTTISIELYTLLDTTMLTHMTDEISVGCYTVSLRIVRMVIIAITGISGVLLPRLTLYYKEGRITECNNIIGKIVEILLFIFVPCGIGIMLVAPMLIRVFFGESFTNGITTLRIASFLIYTLGFSNLFGTQLLLTVECEKKLLIATIVGAITNISLNACLIPQYSQNGAALASVISELFVTCMTFIFSRKYFNYIIRKRVIIGALLGVTVMIIFILGILSLLNTSLFSLMVIVIASAIVYIFINILVRNPVLYDLKEVISHRRTR